MSELGNVDREHKHVCCRIGGTLVGISLGQVQEINRMVEPTWVPLMEPWLRGVINLRGNLVTVVDLNAAVRGAATVLTPRSRTVVVEVDDEVCGMIVDEVGDVVAVDPAHVEPLPSHLPADQRRWYRGLVQLAGELLLLLDVRAIGQLGAESVNATAR